LPEDSIQTSVQEYLSSHSAKISQSFGKGRKASLFILSKSICIGNTDAGIDPGFVDIESTAVFTKDFKHRVPPTKIFAGLAGTAAPNAPADSAGADTKGAGTSGAETEKAGDGKPVELRISRWGSDGRHEATLKALDLFMEKHPGIKVTAEYQGWDGYHDKLMTQTSSGTESDVYQLDNNVYFASLAANDKLGDLTPYIGKQLKLDDYSDSALTWVRYNGVQYGGPIGLNGPLFIWNKKIFDEVGVAYPTNEWSWESFIFLHTV